MARIQWNDRLSVGITEIDAQHKRLIEIINNLDDAMKQGKGKDILHPTISQLINYTNTHFKTEETLMEAANYSDLATHKLAHRDFIKKIAKFRDDYLAGQLCLSIEIMKFLSDWLISHIQDSDLKYAPVLAGK